MEKFIKTRRINKTMTGDKIIESFKSTFSLEELLNDRQLVDEAASMLNRSTDDVMDAMFIYLRLKQQDPQLANALFSQSFDVQTGLIQKEDFEKKYLNDAIRWANAKNLPVCYGMIDVDNFGSFNTKYGRSTGNDVLEMISSYLREVVRSGRERRNGKREKENDRRAEYASGAEPYIEIGRIGGGEEFGFIFYNMDLKTATGIMERVRKKIETSPITYNGERLHVTISGGVTQYIQNEPIEKLNTRAEERMYNAKAQGKNIIVNDKTFDPSLMYGGNH